MILVKSCGRLCTMTKEIPQNFSSKGCFQIEIEQCVPFARAIAVRNLDENQRFQSRIAELAGTQYQPINPLMREALIIAGTLMNEIVLGEPNNLPTTIQALTARVFDYLGDDVFNQMVNDMQKDEVDPLPITGSQLRSLTRTTTESVMTSLMPTSLLERSSVRLLKQVEEAGRIATEKGIAPATVYADDELYAELMRRSQTPGEVAKTGIEMIGQITPDKTREMIVNMIPAIAQTMDEIMEDEPVIGQDEIQEMRQEMLDDPEFKKIIRTVTLQHKRALRTLIGEQIIRFWGQEGLDTYLNQSKQNL